MRVHLIGICGTGMASLAGLLKQAGHHVTGSDTAFYPPMGDALARWGIETKTGFSPAHLDPPPDLVVVGNVCRRDNVEARAAIDGGLAYTSLPGAIERFFLDGRAGWVIAGTHGKTTTTALVTFLLRSCRVDAGFLVGGVARDFSESFSVGAPNAPFVIEGDEYDSAFFEKTPKFWRYHPRAAIVTSLEHDHIDIYPDVDSYRAAFTRFIELIPEDGALVAWAGDPEVRALARSARCRVSFYALDGDDCGDVTPIWLGAPIAPFADSQPFDLFVGGTSCGRLTTGLVGEHNVRNAIASIALVAEAGGLAVSKLASALARFRGIRRRQDLLGIADGVRVYDDFAHHPTAVRETLRGLRARHPKGRLYAVFEPRTATAARRLHQEAYAESFDASDVVLFAPVGRAEIADGDRLDVEALARGLAARGLQSEALGNIDAIVARIARDARPGDTVVLMSNGPFGGIHDKLLVALTVRTVEPRMATAP